MISTGAKSFVLERLEILGDQHAAGKVTKGDKRVQIRALIKGTGITGKDVTADLSELTGNPRDRTVSPLARDVATFGDYVQVNWFVTLRKNIRGGSIVTATVSIHDSASDRLEKKTANAAVFVLPAMQETLQARSVDGEIEVELKLSPLTIRHITPLRIIAEPVNSETAIADQNLPGWTYIPEGIKAYRITAQALEKLDQRVLGASAPREAIGNYQIKDTFTLGLGYPDQIRPEEAHNLKLFILSDDRWLPLPSYQDIFHRMVRTEAAQQLGVYRLLVDASGYPQDIFIYPNPVQFGQFGSVSKTLKFCNVPPGSVIEIYTVTGEKIREIKEVRATEVPWDGKKENGDLVTSGLYLYRVRTPGKDAFGKIAVLR